MIRIMIASDIGLLLGALQAVLSVEHDLLVVATATTDREVIAVAREARPDVALIDLDGTRLHGLRAAAALAAQPPAPAVVALTSRHHPAILRQALAADVRGFASKQEPPAELAELIRRVARGDRMIHPATALATLAVADNPLTEREREVLRLAAQGLPTDAIARDLYLSEGTVRNYVSVVLRKLGCRNRLQAARKAREAGWL